MSSFHFTHILVTVKEFVGRRYENRNTYVVT